jgi:hypothetical protein
MVRATDTQPLTDLNRTVEASTRYVTTAQSLIADQHAHDRFIAAMRESEAAVKLGQVQDAETAFAEIRSEFKLLLPIPDRE